MNVFVGLIAHKRYCWRTKQGVVTIWKEHTQGHSAGGLEKSPSYHHGGPLGRQKIWLSHSEVRPKQREEGRNLKKKKLRNSSKILQLRLSCSHINFSFLSSLQFLSLPFLHWSWSPPCRQVCCLSGKSQMRRNWK